MNTHTLAPLDTALKDVETEREQIRDEREAFEAFAGRIEEIDVKPPMTIPAQSTLNTSVSGRQSYTRSDVFRRAFRDTVMAVPHFEEIYGESLYDHAVGELGLDVAAGLCSDGAVSPRFKRALLQATERGIQNRSAALESLDSETESLAEARSELEAVATRLREITTTDEMRSGTDRTSWISSLEQRCRTIVEERQEFIQNRITSPLMDGHDFCTYLYGHEHSWTYPVLSVGASLLTDIDGLTHRGYTAPK